MMENLIEEEPITSIIEEKIDENEEITSITEEEIDAEEKRFQAKCILEALLFASQDPIPLRKLAELSEESKEDAKTLLEELKTEYEKEKRSFQLEEIAQGYLLRSKPEYGYSIEMLYKSRKPDRISHTQAEVLAIIAYKQPITRAQIEEVRGVDCTSQLQALMEKDLVEQTGKLEVPGRPSLYGVTKRFLQHFGLNDLKGLPKLP